MSSAVRMHCDVERELRAVDWADLGIRLTAYASWKARNLRWRTGRTDVLASGKTAEDVAAEAILKVLEGERAWDPARGALLPYLHGVVDSLISHLADSADNRSREPWADDDDPPAPVVPASDPDERVERLRAALRGERQLALLAIVDAIAGACEAKPQALAQHLGTTVADVNNRLKRLRRYAQRVLGTARGGRGAQQG
jgi:DNA-directed RNA polymerase specialized sigma24 family protein